MGCVGVSVGVVGCVGGVMQIYRTQRPPWKAVEAQGEQRRGAAAEEGERKGEKRRQAGRHRLCIYTNQRSNTSVISADERRCIGTATASSDPDPGSDRPPKMRGLRTRTTAMNSITKLTLDGLHGVLHLEEAALGGPNGHVRVVLVAEHRE